MAEWIVISVVVVVLVFFSLTVLALMREVVILRSEVKLFRDLIQHPPPPSFVGDIAPSTLVQALDGTGSRTSSRHLVAFLAPGCAPCDDLAEQLADAVDEERLSADDVSVIVWAYTQEEGRRFADRISLRCVVDEQGQLSRAWEVRATPTLFLLSTEDRRVVDYTPEGSIEWVLSRMSGHEKLTPLLA